MTNSPKILVVDDEDLLRECIVDHFELDGYKVSQASSGQKAIERLKKEAFDIVISDIRMADGDGITLLKSICPSNNCATHIFLMSGFPEYSVEQAKALGAINLWTKPLNLDHVITEIEEFWRLKTKAPK